MTHPILTIINTKAFSQLPEHQRTIFFELKMTWKIFSVKKNNAKVD